MKGSQSTLCHVRYIPVFFFFKEISLLCIKTSGLKNLKPQLPHQTI